MLICFLIAYSQRLNIDLNIAKSNVNISVFPFILGCFLRRSEFDRQEKRAHHNWPETVDAQETSSMPMRDYVPELGNCNLNDV
jgi:hypothetical protein